jgi:HSP20 family protein
MDKKGEHAMVEVLNRSRISPPGCQSNTEQQSTQPEILRWRNATRQHVWRPPTDVYETEEAIIVRVEIAGMREVDFSVQLIENSLQIRGARQDVSERRSYHQMEIPFGEFSSEIDLLVPVAADQIEAVYRDGFLRIVLPKARPQQIKVSE